MKSISITFITFFITAYAFAQKPEPYVVSCLRSVVVSQERNDTLHQIANVFSGFMGDALKKQYPSKVQEVLVNFYLKGDTLVLSYMGVLKRCSPGEAQYYFEHRGACTVLPDELAVRVSAKKKADAQTDEFLKKNAQWQVPFREHTNVIRVGSNYWVVYENFLASPKQ